MKRTVLSAFLLFATTVFSQTHISLQDCESQFLKNNLYLLANHYNIETAQAQVLQAKIWDNPSFGFEINAYAPYNDKKFFNTGPDGEKSAYIQQLIHIGGQRRNQIELAKTNIKLAELDFSILLRDLKFQLRNYFFTIYYDTFSIEQIDKQITNLKSLIDAYAEQERKGNVSLKDLVRLQNLYLSLKTNRTDLMTEIIENKKNLELLVSNDANVNLKPSPTKEEIDLYKKPITTQIKDLQKLALENRPDLQKAIKNIEANQWNLKLQRSLSIPDVTLGASYDQNGGAFSNQGNLTLGIPLPLWNKNKGNIKTAKAQVSQAEAEKSIQILQINNEVKSAYLKYVEQKSSYELVNSTIPTNLEIVFKGVYDNFIKRNISMLEFTDFQESYHESILSLNQISKSYINACEQINYTTASKLF
jgi:cobalt-zinc-cadmium efflux system outer membrane protein